MKFCYYYKKTVCILFLLHIISCSHQEIKNSSDEKVYMASGIKIGEATNNSIIIWARLTQYSEPNYNGTPVKDIIKESELANAQNSVVGTEGQIRVTYWTNSKNKQISEWMPVEEKTDFSHKFQLNQLSSGEKYHILIDGRKDSSSPIFSTTGSFQTAPTEKQIVPIRFVVMTCQDFTEIDDKKNGFRIYPLMQSLKPNFSVHNGDLEYYDKPRPYANSVKKARFRWNRTYSLLTLKSFHTDITSYFLKDDHDTLKNDCWPGQNYGKITWQKGINLFKEQFPVGETPYKTVRWGKDVQVWFIEGRDFRSSNKMKDGQEKTILGQKQKEWLFKTLKESTASFKILISPTPIIGPDHQKKKDNHSNVTFKYEGDQLRTFFATLENFYIICGDRHWQYHSSNSSGINEFCPGPASNGKSTKPKTPLAVNNHYTKVTGGFLSVDITRKDNHPEIKFTFYDTKGNIHYIKEFLYKNQNPNL